MGRKRKLRILGDKNRSIEQQMIKEDLEIDIGRANIYSYSSVAYLDSYWNMLLDTSV